MKEHKLGARSGYLIIVSVFLILVNVILGVVLINISQKALVGQMEGRMLDIANTAADMLNGDELAKLTKEDKGSEEYQRVSDTLANFWSNIQLKYIYCIQQVGEKEFAFSVDPTQPDPGEFGEPVVYTDALYAASKGIASVDKVPYEDAWGRFYSAYSPVFDSKGKVAGIVAVDFSADWYDEQTSAQARTVLIACGLSILAGAFIVIIVTDRTRRRNRLLYAQLNSLADNIETLVYEVSNTTHLEHDQPVHFESGSGGDDIKDLSDKINSMQDNLRTEIECVHRMAFVDALTTVGNTAAYLETVQAMNDSIKDGNGKFCVATFDLNGLKKINDTHGHDVGDKALIDAANALTGVFGKNNVYRAGGDEFIVVLPTDSAEDMDKLFALLDKDIAAKNKGPKPYDIPLSMSKGYAIYDPELDTEFKTVFLRSDQVMYHDKDVFYKQNPQCDRR